MTFTLIDRPFDAARDLAPDGAPWPFALERPGEEDVVLADSAADIVSFIVDGYEDIPAGERGNIEALQVRVVESIRMAALIQSMMVADAHNEGRFDVDAADEETLTALLGDKTIPISGIDSWDHEIPLVLITTDYEPFTVHMPPVGNVLWIDPESELSFLKSLANLGIINLYIYDGDQFGPQADETIPA